ncbi:glycosyltransferase family 1 protein [Alicyclobacillus fastidiosus]|uniref:Glycosyltransferase family 1 protein n=1 Tax=Alicyclobacillus fastidiosus TaxID=392011 RepID=A0ABY6ZDS8_9BACL|nr:glycosyltransferase family 1 protein [Alicyclobacillus fastidiosus]WAH41040.1 glycosyltransferase family 1 protein [Alicyclobacillus fastidiosus]GMA62566.1 glycosyl transferase [Alicyclobacillus fastidiosus]
MRIAIFSETFLPGTDGVVTRLCNTLKHLEEAGHEVLLIAPNGAPPKYASATIVGVPSFRFFLYPGINFASPLAKVGKHLKQFEPELIHSVNPGFLSFAAIYYAKKYRLPLIMSYHTLIPAYARYYNLSWLEPALWRCFRTIHNCADINLCTSQAMLKELAARGFRNLDLWERGVDLQLYSPMRRSDAMRSRLTNGDQNGKLVLYVGRLAAEKAIERLRPCLDKAPDVHLAIIGDGPHRSELERVFADSNTIFTGYLFGEELAEAYASADGFVFPSTTETLGLVLYEAMASGLPIMAADSPASREVLDGGAAGFIFQPLNPDSIYQAMHDMLYDVAKRKFVKSRGQEIVQALNWSGPTKQLVNYYSSLFKSN